MTSLKMADISRMVNRYQDGGAVYLNGPSSFQPGTNSVAAFLPEGPPNFRTNQNESQRLCSVLTHLEPFQPKHSPWTPQVRGTSCLLFWRGVYLQ